MLTVLGIGIPHNKMMRNFLKRKWIEREKFFSDLPGESGDAWNDQNLAINLRFSKRGVRRLGSEYTVLEKSLISM